jgi:hypothetical protein
MTLIEALTNEFVEFQGKWDENHVPISLDNITCYTKYLVYYKRFQMMVQKIYAIM